MNIHYTPGAARVSSLSSLALLALHHLVVVHPSPLLCLGLAVPSVLAEVPAPGHGAVGRDARFRVKLEQSPHPSAVLAPSRGLGGALQRVLEEHLDLVARGVGALLVLARRRVNQELHGLAELLLARALLLVADPAAKHV